jgi:hypothetical protein
VDLGFMVRFVVILGQTLPNLPGGNPYHRIVVRVVLRIALKDLNPQRAFL